MTTTGWGTAYTAQTVKRKGTKVYNKDGTAKSGYYRYFSDQYTDYVTEVTGSFEYPTSRTLSMESGGIVTNLGDSLSYSPATAGTPQTITVLAK